jgi:neopullulanase
MQAPDFAKEMDRLLTMYKPEITRAQLNLLDSHDMPRFLSCVNGDKDSLKLAWLFMFTLPGAPCIYYGDEVGLDGGHDPECRKSFPWDEGKWDKDLHAYAKTCIALRRDHPALRRGNYERILAEDDVMAFSRTSDSEKILAAFNASTAQRTIELPAGKSPVILLGRPIISGNRVTIPPRSGIVIK